MTDNVELGQYFLSVCRLILSGSFLHFYMRVLHSPTTDATGSHSPTTDATQAHSPTTDPTGGPLTYHRRYTGPLTYH
jgi:hypothetical protein